MILKATINLLVVVGLVGVQGLNCQGKNSILQFSTSIIFSLIIIRVKILGQTLYNKSWVWEEKLRWLIIPQDILPGMPTLAVSYMKPRTITFPTIGNGDAACAAVTQQGCIILKRRRQHLESLICNSGNNS